MGHAGIPRLGVSKQIACGRSGVAPSAWAAVGRAQGCDNRLIWNCANEQHDVQQQQAAASHGISACIERLHLVLSYYTEGGLPLQTCVNDAAGRVTHCEGPRPSFPCPYIRVSFAQATDADLREGMQRLSVAIKRYQRAGTANGFGHIAAAVPCAKVKPDGKHDAPALSLHAAAHTAANMAPDL